MDPSTSALGLKVVAPALLAGYRALRHELARTDSEHRMAGGLAGIDDLLDEAIAVLAREAGTLWAAIHVTAKGALTRPELLNHDVPRAWIATQEAQVSLKLAARAAIRGEDDGPYAARAISHYQKFLTDEVDEKAAMAPYASSAYAAALDFLLASLRRTLTAGDRAVLQAVHGVREEIARVRPEDTSDIVDAHVERLVDRIRARRFFRSADTSAEASHLVSALLDGRLKGANPQVRARALAWCARFLSFSETEVARTALAEASVLGDPAMPEIRIAQAFNAAVGDFEGALALLNVERAPMEATAAFQIMRHGLGSVEGLVRAGEARLDAAGLDSDGRYARITALIETSAWDEAIEATGTLSAADFEATPALLWVAGSLLVAAQLPDDLKRNVLQDIPALPAAFPLRDDKAAIEQRRLARSFVERAAHRCAALDLSREATAAMRYSLWLGLRDPDLSSDACADLHNRMREPANELVYLPLALGIVGEIDLARAEAAIRREIARGGRNDPNVAWAAVALLLYQSSRDPAEAAAYIERNRALLAEHLDLASMVQLEVGVLTHAGRHDAALAVLEASSVSLPEAQRALLSSAIEQSDARPSLEALEAAYGADQQTATLAHLVDRYRELDYSPRFLELAERLLREMPTHRSAFECLAFLGDYGRNVEALELIQVLGDIVHEDPRLALQAGWMYLRLGQLDKAEAMLGQAKDAPEAGQVRALRYQLLIASGKWEGIDGFLDEQWRMRETRSPLELVQCAALAAQTHAKRVGDLAKDAVERAPDDPHVLVAAYSAITAAGLEESIPQASSWIGRAAELSGEDGPVQQRSIAELFDDQPEWDTRVEEARRGWADAELPMAGVAMMLRRPWFDLQLSPMLENRDYPEASRRRPVSLFSGRRRADALAGMKLPREIAIDRHALVTLAAVGMLETVLDAFERIHVSHNLFSDLFEQRNRTAFHQPSKIQFARRLLELLARNRVRAFEPSSIVNTALLTEVGESRARLLSEAASQKVGQHLVIHPFPMSRVGTLLNVPADLGSYAGLVCSCSGVLDALERAGRVGKADLATARGYLDQHDHRWPDEPLIEEGATLYLTDLAVDYLRYSGLIDRIAAAGHTVIVSGSEIAEAQALRDVEALTQAVDGVLESLRASLVPAIESGRLRLGAAHPTDEAGANYIDDILGLIARADTLVSDDRFINRYANFEYEVGTRRILTSLDLIERLVRAGRIAKEKFDEVRSRLRADGVGYVGTDVDELNAMLASFRDRGAVRETGEMRTLRENLRLTQVRGWFNPECDWGWLVAFQAALADALADQWREEISDEHARAASDWLYGCMQSRDWADRDAEAPLDGLAKDGSVLDLMKLVGLAGQINGEGKQRYAAWLADDVLTPLWESEPRLQAAFEKRLREMVKVVAQDFSRDAPDIDERTAIQLSFEALPNFLKVALLQDEGLQATTGYELDCTVAIDAGRFQRSIFWKAVTSLYADPAGVQDLSDVDGHRWTLSTDASDPGWALRVTRAQHDYVVRGLSGLHWDAGARLSILDTYLSQIGHKPEALADWRARLGERMLNPVEIERLEAGVRSLPGFVKAEISETLSANEASIALLVPAARDYWEALLGEGEAENFERFLADVLPTHASRLRAEHQDADHWLLLLAAHSRILGRELFADLTPEAWIALGEWALATGDPMAKVGFIELALAMAARDERLQSIVGSLIEQIEALDASDTTGPLHLLSCLAIFVDGELSRLGVLVDWSPFRRRLAAFAQSALIARIVHGQVDTGHFAKFCTDQRGWRFLVQSLVDLRKEPRWRPDYITAQQLHHELIGRIVNAAIAIPSEGLGERLSGCLIEGPSSLRERMPYPMAFLPGPLEGAVEVLPLSERFCEELEKAFADETPTYEGLLRLVNFGAMFAIPEDLLVRIITRLASTGPRLLALIPPEKVYDHLLALSHVAASHRSAKLADAIQVLVRISRVQSQWDAGQEMQIALYLAASRAEIDDWHRCIGRSVAELVSHSQEQEFATQILTWTEALCEIDPALRGYTGRSIARLRLLLDT